MNTPACAASWQKPGQEKHIGWGITTVVREPLLHDDNVVNRVARPEVAL